MLFSDLQWTKLVRHESPHHTNPDGMDKGADEWTMYIDLLVGSAVDSSVLSPDRPHSQSVNTYL